jgi:hypothetical protein
MLLTAQQDQDTPPESNVNETLLALILPYLDSSTLANVAATSQALLQQVCQRDELWDPVFQKLDYGIVRAKFKYELLRIPPRIPGHYLCRVVEDETTGMVGNRLFPLRYGKSIYTRAIANENGVLVDLFRVPGTNAKTYLCRDFPVFCSDCNVSLATTKELVDHCCTDAHIFAKCPELLDPRRKGSFENSTVYEKAKALGEYRARIESYFRKASMVPKNQQVLRGVTWRIRKELAEWDSDLIRNTLSSFACSIGTVENVTEACIERAITDSLSSFACSIGTVEDVTAACIEWAITDFMFGNTADAIMGAYQGYRGWQSTRFKKLGLLSVVEVMIIMMIMRRRNC